MAALALCGGCGSGRHDRHVEHWNNPGPGVLGGAFCPCKGDCKPPDLSAIFGSVRRTEPEGAGEGRPTAEAWVRRIASEVLGPPTHAPMSTPAPEAGGEP